MPKPRIHLCDLNTGPPDRNPLRTLCGRLAGSVKIVVKTTFDIPLAVPDDNVCAICLQRDREEQDDFLHDLFRNGGSADEYEVFGKYFFTPEDS